MKKLILSALLAIVTALGVSADKGDIAVGAQFAFASKNSMAGLGLQLQVEPVSRLRIAPEFMYYFKNDGMSAINANANLHYVIPTSPSFAIYPLLGFTYANFKYDAGMLGETNVDRCGANVGLGAQYRIQDRLYFYSEQRFQIIEDYNQSVTILGLKYSF
jgi:outer membrane protein X